MIFVKISTNIKMVDPWAYKKSSIQVKIPYIFVTGALLNGTVQV